MIKPKHGKELFPGELKIDKHYWIWEVWLYNWVLDYFRGPGDSRWREHSNKTGMYRIFEAEDYHLPEPLEIDPDLDDKDE